MGGLIFTLILFFCARKLIVRLKELAEERRIQQANSEHLKTTEGKVEAEIFQIQRQVKKIKFKIERLEKEAKNFTTKLEEVGSKSVIEVVEKNIKARKKSIDFYNSLCNLHERRMSKLETFKKEYILLKEIYESNKNNPDLITEVSNYRNLTHDIELELKYEYSSKVDVLLKKLENNDFVSVNAAINFLEETIQNELEMEKTYQDFYSLDALKKSSVLINDKEEEAITTERLILEDFNNLKLETLELIKSLEK